MLVGSSLSAGRGSADLVVAKVSSDKNEFDAPREYGLEAGDVVTVDQMRVLFAEGCHPLAGTSGPGASGPILALGAPTGHQKSSNRSRRRYGIGLLIATRLSAANCPAWPGRFTRTDSTYSDESRRSAGERRTRSMPP
jgi:hypothetical protein